jgi:Ca2+-binding RTX toxin-like protein
VFCTYTDDTTITLGNGAGDKVSGGRTLDDVITLGDGAGDTVNANFGSSGSNDKITLGDGAGDVVTRGFNGATITVGNGAGDIVAVDAGSPYFGDGSATKIIVGNGNNDMVAIDSPGVSSTIALGNGNNDTVMASAAPDSRITVGNGNDTVLGGANNTIAIGNGQNQLVAAPGDVWTVGSGQDTFAFDAGFGNNTITDFNTSRDVLQFNHALFVNFAAAMADTKQIGANTVITYDANDSVTLTGVAASHLTASNFKFT